MYNVNFYDFIMITIILIILRYITLEHYQDIIVNGYLFMLILAFSITYYYTGNYNISLFSSLSVVLVRTFYRYNVSEKIIKNSTGFENTLLFTVGLGYLYVLINNYNNIDQNTFKLMNFGMTSYIFFSMIELFIHKYVMHCKTSPELNYIFQNIPFVNSLVHETCENHMNHHLDVNPDMTLDKKKENGLYMDWSLFPLFLLIIFLCLFASSHITNYDISITTILIL